MSSRPLRVQMLGLLPAILKPCGPACAQPFMNHPVEKLTTEEMGETPRFVQENGEQAHALAEHLFRDFGNQVRIEVVGLDSPRGIWLALRHRVGKGFAVVVGNRHVLRSPAEYEAVKEVVERTLRERDVQAG